MIAIISIVMLMPLVALRRRVGRTLTSLVRLPEASLRLPVSRDRPECSLRSIAEAREAMERVLLENILPFWLAGVAGPAGQFRSSSDVRGNWQPRAPRRLVQHARILWFMAQMRERSELAATLAERAFLVLADRFWDRAHGGFHWEIDADGQYPTMPHKHLYGQAQSLYAVSCFALATGRVDALELARRTFGIIEHQHKDHKESGYHEYFRADWRPIHASRRGYLGTVPAVKTANTHLHMLEATTVYLKLTGDPLARNRLEELAGILSGPALDLVHGNLLDRHWRDWSPVTEGDPNRASYGHDLELIHLLHAADHVLGAPLDGRVELYRRWFRSAHAFGEDAAEGGIWLAGPPGRPATDRRKVWWVQAEAMLGMLQLFELTGDEPCLQAFMRTLGWVLGRQIDWKRGEWHAEILGERAFGPKAGPWKDPYHNGRALLEGIAILDRLALRAPGSRPVGAEVSMSRQETGKTQRAHKIEQERAGQ
jgi:mannobiose 2-epimerase